MTSYDTIVENIIKVRGVITGQDLALAVMSDVNVSKFDNNIYVTSLAELRAKGIICCLMYTPPNGYSGVLYFPGKTKFEV